MKTNLILSASLAAISLFVLSACQQSQPATEGATQQSAAAQKPTGSMTTSSVPITDTEPTSLEVNSYQMNITKDGFVPKELTVKVGATVVFVNSDDAQHWPASGPHPVHTFCPGLDAKVALNKGETFEFTFDKAEVCPIHDHLNPGTTGTITVVE
jgi:plastocyanin